MDKTEIEPQATYTSVNDVPYRVLRIDGQKVTAQCMSGAKNAPFEISLGRFAATMKSAAIHR